jgi:manganese transport protein
MLYIALGILGATVMPHNLYLHSSIVQTRRYTRHAASKQSEAIRFATIDFVDRADVGALHQRRDPDRGAAASSTDRHRVVADIGDAYQLLSPLLGDGRRDSVRRGVALFRAERDVDRHARGQIVMEGFVNIRLRPWLRRLITRSSRIVPASSSSSLRRAWTGALLILSQVISESAAAVRRVSAGQLYTAIAARWAVRRAALGSGPGVDDCRYHCGAERLAALSDISG